MINQTIQQFRKFIGFSLDLDKHAALWCNQHGDLHVTHTHTHNPPQGGEQWVRLGALEAGRIEWYLS